jgi:hypothetical protein
MVDGGEGQYLDHLNIEPSVGTRCVLANQWQPSIFSGKLPRPRDTQRIIEYQPNSGIIYYLFDGH